MAKSLSLVEQLLAIRESGLTTVLHTEHCLDTMGLLKSRTSGGFLDSDNVLAAIKREKEIDAEEVL